MVHKISLAIMALALAGCSPSAVTTHVMIEEHARGRFQHDLDAANFARRAQHLPELDPCSEKFWYDRAWALRREPCASQVRRWEGGDTTAINPIGTVMPGFRRTIPPAEQAIYDRRWQPQRDSSWVHRAP